MAVEDIASNTVIQQMCLIASVCERHRSGFPAIDINIRRGNVLAIGTTMFSCDRCPWRTVYSPKFNEMLQMQSSLPGSCVRRAQSDVDDNCLCLAD
ncbi:predicted protein [Plenodomus lingam JN3]|uniref:Predicted protein n=1 Tax=Leptosphaeria maculans (strain JN3 / isolate v23.1.3 / race Av1-4-5-6-7-8) TaxID=985895 RepID=E5AAR4_LEPMJ|nr:predicted protein [Plenodomus lingam JN3]CBY00755.1 predicted protein [Plenodomus lingam JN3]